MQVSIASPSDHKNTFSSALRLNWLFSFVLQIRIRILEGRQLVGNNIHPVVRVTVAGQRRETTVKRSTNKPVYNQVWTHILFRETAFSSFMNLTES